MQAAQCKHPIADNGGNILFHVGNAYKVLQTSTRRQIMLKDEMGCLRWMPIDDKDFKKHFELKELTE